MHGSPLIRTFLVLLALALTAAGLVTLTRAPLVPVAASEPVPEGEATGELSCPFVLTLSAPAQSITLESAGKVVSIPPVSQVVSGTLPLEPGHPTIFIDIVWAEPDSTPRFAKLVLEPTGRPTQARVFDAAGPLSDAWELHLHE